MAASMPLLRAVGCRSQRAEAHRGERLCRTGPARPEGGSQRLTVRMSSRPAKGPARLEVVLPDLVLEQDGSRIIVQAKRYSQPVGVKGVQEAYAARPHYRAGAAWVISNSTFTPAPASSPRVRACSCGTALCWPHI